MAWCTVYTNQAIHVYREWMKRKLNKNKKKRTKRRTKSTSTYKGAEIKQCNIKRNYNNVCLFTCCPQQESIHCCVCTLFSAPMSCIDKTNEKMVSNTNKYARKKDLIRGYLYCIMLAKSKNSIDPETLCLKTEKKQHFHFEHSRKHSHSMRSVCLTWWVFACMLAPPIFDPHCIFGFMCLNALLFKVPIIMNLMEL